MGLDMYLSKRTYINNSKWAEAKDRHSVTVAINGEPVPHIKPERITRVIEEVAYWRKANAIHNWFVNNCQDGKDECQLTEVTRTQLQELLDVVNAILDTENNDELINSTLLPCEGFFFGSTDIGDVYYESLVYTRDVLTQILAESAEHTAEVQFFYEASW